MSASSPNRPPGRRTVTVLTCLTAIFPFLQTAQASPASAPPPKLSKPPVETLRDKYWLRSLPDTISVPVAGSDGLFVTKQLIDASVDDVAFAASALSRNASAVLRIASDLQSVHDLARETGAVGAANAIAAAIKAKESRR